MSKTIHIRSPKPSGNHYNAKTLCGKRLHSTATTCVFNSKVKIDMSDKANTGTWGWHNGEDASKPGRMDVLWYITPIQADQMDGIHSGLQKNGTWVPSPTGPMGEKTPRVRDMEWCSDCFDGGMRGLHLLARTEL